MNAADHVGPGWAPIAQRAIDSLERMGIRITQVKEKFGELRIYTDSYNEEGDQVIRNAEHACAEICEDCGKPGKLRDNAFWLRTLCEDCNYTNDNRT